MLKINAKILKLILPLIILRISGLPKINLIRHFFWKIFSNRIYKISCPTTSTYNFIVDKKKFNLEEFISMGAWHHMSGTRAGTNIKDSVVDKNLKIHDIDNIYMSGSSNFTTGGYSNPTFTIIQLAIRLSEKIKERLYS